MSEATLVSMTLPDLFLLCTNICPLLTVPRKFPEAERNRRGAFTKERKLRRRVWYFWWFILGKLWTFFCSFKMFWQQMHWKEARCHCIYGGHVDDRTCLKVKQSAMSFTVFHASTVTSKCFWPHMPVAGSFVWPGTDGQKDKVFDFYVDQMTLFCSIGLKGVVGWIVPPPKVYIHPKPQNVIHLEVGSLQV